jgi:acetate kinase
MVNHKAGMVALSGLANDMKAVRKAAAAGDAKARLAAAIFARDIRKSIGGFAFLLGGLDAVVFTGGIGEHDAATRVEVLAGLEAFGVATDPDANGLKEKGLRRIDAATSATAIYVVPAEEDRTIARHVGRMAREMGIRAPQKLTSRTRDVRHPDEFQAK